MTPSYDVVCGVLFVDFAGAVGRGVALASVVDAFCSAGGCALNDDAGGASSRATMITGAGV